MLKITGKPSKVREIQVINFFKKSIINNVRFFFLSSIAMSVVGLNGEDQRNILQLVAAILHLGNVTFVEDERNFAQVENEQCKRIVFLKFFDQSGWVGQPCVYLEALVAEPNCKSNFKKLFQKCNFGLKIVLKI